MFTIHGLIERRVLLNYRIRPEVLEKALPTPFRPKIYKGWGVGGICMIRFKGLRPQGVPAALGVGSENAAHRVAVLWNENGQEKEGVYIPRRDTDSRFTELLGGRLFPGIFNRSQFEVHESDGKFSIRIVRTDGTVEAAFAGAKAEQLSPGSIFPNMEEASNFFYLGATGYSATNETGHFHGMELKTVNWKVEPLKIDRAESRFFSDESSFPHGSIELDCALLMTQMEHSWHSRPDLWVSPEREYLTRSRPEVFSLAKP